MIQTGSDESDQSEVCINCDNQSEVLPDQMVVLQVLHPLQLYQQVPGHADVLGGDVLQSDHRSLVLGSGDVLLAHLSEHGVLGDP